MTRNKKISFVLQELITIFQKRKTILSNAELYISIFLKGNLKSAKIKNLLRFFFCSKHL